MADPTSRWKFSWARFLRSWQAPAAVGVLILAGMIYWLAPRPVERVIPVDGSTSWKASEAPPRREIVWQPAREIPALFAIEPDSQSPALRQQTELVTPKLSENGSALYFSRRLEGTQSDIYRSRLVDGTWQPAEAVDELNTPANELSPVLSPDGRQLYFYSDRPGGFGGTDIYVAERMENGRWDRPRNLGPRINTRAHEYDPAVSPDGLSLYFASNRTDQTAERVAENGEPDSESPVLREWNVTLRAQLDLTMFDLYRARRDSLDSPWRPSIALDGLNRSDSTEGAPFVSPGGAFLYFASDRISDRGRTRRGPDERRNLDLYRARIVGDGFAEAENLGPSINTAAHETEPGLSPEGFTLVFSSDRDGNDRLYASTAEEVFYETEWDASHLNSLGVPWWWWLPLTLLLLAAFLLALFYYRDWLMRRVWPARFFLGSVLLNLLVLLLLAVWTLPDVVDAIVGKVAQIVPGTQIFDENDHQSHEDGRESYEKVADLKSAEPMPIPDVARRETSPLSMPERTENPVPTIPLEVARALPQNRVLYVPRKTEPVETIETRLNKPVPLARRRPPRPMQPLESTEPAQQPLEAVDLPQQRAVAETDVNLQRQATTPHEPNAQHLTQPEDNPLTRTRPAAVAVRAAKPLEDSPRQTEIKSTPLFQRKPKPTVPNAVAAADGDSKLPPAVNVPAEQEDGARPVDVAKADVGVPVPATFAAANDAVSSPAAAEAQPDRLALVKPAEADVRPTSSKPISVPESLNRPARRPARNVPPMQPANAEPVQLAAAETPTVGEVTGTDVELARSPERPFEAAVKTPQELTGPATRIRHRIVSGELSDKRNDEPPAFSPLANTLDRRRARATRVALAEDNVGLRSMFTLRQGDTRRKYIDLLGGTQESEKAVNLGLEWLAKNQEPDGSWDLKKHEGGENTRTAGTGLGVLPFLAAGYTHDKPGQYRKNVADALRRLLDNQQENGSLLAKGDSQTMYSHGIAAIALCEAYGMTHDPELDEPVRKALEFIVQSQHKGSGGWRYNPNESADTSVVGWQMMALKSGEMAGLTVEKGVYDNVNRWFRAVEGKQGNSGTFGYTNRSISPAMTAEGLLSLQFMGTDRNSPRLRSGADYLLQNLPEPNQNRTSYYWYYGTQVMYHMQGKYWDAWNERLRDMLVETQIKNGKQAGSWQPRDNWESRGGRVYSTSLKLLMLEVYYSRLPLYEQLEE